MHLTDWDQNSNWNDSQYIFCVTYVEPVFFPWNIDPFFNVSTSSENEKRENTAGILIHDHYVK